MDVRLTGSINDLSRCPTRSRLRACLPSSVGCGYPDRMIHVDERQRRELVDLCARYGFARLEVFGSVARGEERAESDLDVLYDLLPGRHITWEVVDAAEEMSVILGRPVDLVSRRGVHPLLRERIESEAQALYAA
ncbi:hypothetical protein CCE01nite_09190 [Cellulomonas cellasea]|nr:hypothetical protein CCE01nite_09190 [Cellulomonas cellasea]